MGFWSFFQRKRGSAAEDVGAEPAASAPPVASRTAPQRPDDPAHALPKDISRILTIGEPGGPTLDEAVSLFRGLRSTPDEARAVEELLRTAGTKRLPEELLLALAAALIDRGQLEAAAKALASATSSSALMMLADLAERRGDVPTALSLIERVLLRDLDHPGARERHRRWRAELGGGAPQKAIAPGATVVTREADAPFDLLREIGRGGAGAVYEAMDRELGRHVALKIYHQPERDRSQLAHEARVAVALEGPGIVRVLDVDPEHGWLALEWAHGSTVREQIRSRALPRILPIERWALPLARALARVHAAGWVHHDVKPANVLLSRSGAAILTDFGTARRAGEPSPPGSLGYISPERMKGRVSDPRDDVYGFGRVLEDVLEIVPDAQMVARFRALAAVCTGPDEHRPESGSALLTRLRVEVLGAHR